MKCIRSDYCRSPVACGGFGYCRERNVAPVTDGQIRAHQAEEALRAKFTEVLAAISRGRKDNGRPLAAETARQMAREALDQQGLTW